MRVGAGRDMLNQDEDGNTDKVKRNSYTNEEVRKRERKVGIGLLEYWPN